MKSRRKFIKQSAGFSLICAGLGLLDTLEGCVPVRYANYTRLGDQWAISKLEFIKDDFVMLSSNDLKAPIYLVKLGDNHFKAIYLLCTHKGCDVKPAGPILACPCHGSEYTQTGEILKGPAERNLQIFPVSYDEKNIYIQINL